MRSLKILTWHVHGNYLYYLSQARHQFFVPFKPDRSGDYIGLTKGLQWPENLVEVPADEVKHLDLDIVLFQRRSHYEREQHDILGRHQMDLPRIFLEHDPPREHPTDTTHVVDDPNMLLVHVTAFNRLMWDSGRTPVRVVEHGVMIPGDVSYRGDLERGISVVNNMKLRGRRLGCDVFKRAEREVPLDLAGMNSKELGGLGEIPHEALHGFVSRYRFFFNPIRYTSLGLALCEAMMIGMPIVALATTEVVSVVRDGVNGFTDTEPERLVERMRMLLADPGLSRKLGSEARRIALERFGIERFVRDWDEVFNMVAGASVPIRGTRRPAPETKENCP